MALEDGPPSRKAEADTDILDSAQAGPAAIRGGALRSIGYAGGLLLALVSVPFLVRHLGVVDFGRYVTVLALVTIVSNLADAGLTALGIREYAVLQGAEREDLMRHLLGIRVTFGVVGTIAAAGFSVVAGFDSAQVVGTVLGGLGMTLALVQTTYAVPLSATLRLGAVTLFDFSRQALTVILTLALVVAGAGLLPFLAIPVPVGVVMLVGVAVYIHRQVPLTPAFHWDRWRVLLAQTLPFALASAIAVVYYRLAVILVSLISTEQQTGYFSASFRIIEVLLMIPALLVSAVFPILSRAARNDRDRLAYALQRMFDGSLVLGAWLAIGVVAVAPTAIAVIAGPRFSPSVAVLQLQGPAIAATLLATTWGNVLLALREHRALVITNTAVLLAATCLILWFASQWGAKGAAGAMLLSELLLASSYGLWIAVRHPNLRVNVAMVPRVAAATAASAASLLLPLPPLVLTALGTAVLFALLAVLHAIPREATDALMVWLHRARTALRS